MSLFCRFIVILSLLGAACSQAPDTNDTKKNLEEFNQTSLETKDAEKNHKDVPEILIENYNGTSIETGNVTKKYKDDPKKFDFNQTSSVTKTAGKKPRKTCKIQNTSNISKVQHDAFNQCISLHINGSELQTELEDSRKTGSMNMVFEKNCGKWPLIHKCVKNAKLKIKRCLTYSDEKLYNQTIDIVKNLQGYLCFSNDGWMLRKFVVEGGVQCVQEQYQGIKNCFNETDVYSDFPQTGNFLTTTLSMIVYTSRDPRWDCKDFVETRNCVTEVLKNCPNGSAASIVDASFKFVKEQIISCEIDPELLKILWYFIVLYVILMYIYFYLLIKQKFAVTNQETPPTI